MKKWTVPLIVLVLTGCTTVASATGGTTQNAAPEKVTVQVYVDNVPHGSTEGLSIDGVLYLPTMDIEDAADVAIKTENAEARIYLHKAAPSAPFVAGSDEHATKINAAAALLREKDPEDYAKLTRYAVLIVPGDKNTSILETNVITVAEEDLDKGTLTWIAGTLAHEAEHLRIYHTDRALAANVKENERLAYTAGVNALKLVGADQREIDWALKAMQNPPAWEDNAK